MINRPFAHPCQTIALLTMLAAGCAQAADAVNDPYESYVKTSKDFKSVKQDKAWALKAWPDWYYMPWQAPLGTDDKAAAYYEKIGWNGQTLDFRGGTGALPWINQHKLHFYCDHTADKGFLHLWDGDVKNPSIYNPGLRPHPLNAALKAELEGKIRTNIEAVKSSPYRSAYALDDELGWGHFSKPCMWRITDDDALFPAWLKEVYGQGKAPNYSGWISYDALRDRLPGWKVKDFDVRQLMDQWTFNDSLWNNFIGDLVEYANTVDPATPCGYVGGQGISPFGGYDPAKYMRKIQWVESYGANGVLRSLNPHNGLPLVTTHFHQNNDDTIWQCWYNLAHGNKGHIGWVEKIPGEADVAAIAPNYHDAGQKIGPLMSGAEWVHDGVGIYYNHASVQLGWIMDAQAHGKTWRNRNTDSMGSQNVCREAWENMLRDDGLQYNFISYADVIQNGIPKGYRVLILSATLCLSDAEARKIKEFCKAGGTVVADYMPGLWDQHGKGRPNGGALDDLFGVKHDPDMGPADVFQGGNLWAEVDQDAHYGESGEKLLGGNQSIRDKSGYNKAVRNMGVAKVNKYGAGTAVLLNISPSWYSVYRGRPYAEASAKRDVFTQYVKKAIGTRWIQLQGAGDRENGYEITYWTKGGRMIVFLCYKPEITAGSMGGGNSVGLKSVRIPITFAFRGPVQDVRDERAEKTLGSGREFNLTWKMNEAVVLSFKGLPPRQQPVVIP
ncbi:MAG: beta-galactosidase trimerization domain-containing protein [bacterium]